MAMESSTGRRVQLLLFDGADVAGLLPPYWVPTPWWSEVGSVVEGARTHNGAEVTVLRLLGGRPAHPDQPALGGDVVYVAQLEGRLPAGLCPWKGVLRDDALRASWARPGGPAADLAWAEQVLARRGRPRTGPPVQTRTWNLSSIWRIPTATGDVWLKVVPRFLGPEGAVLDALRGHPVPRLVAHDGCGRTLLAHVPGANQYGAGLASLLSMVRTLVEMQAAWLGRANELLSLGVPDWRRDALVAAAEDVVAGGSRTLSADLCHRLDRLIAGLDRRLTDIESCGVPNSLFHGDLHPGNFRGAGASPLVLLDWGDCGVGHPLLDAQVFLDAAPPGFRDIVVEYWADQWSAHVPGSDPVRALALLEPIAAIRRAAVYLHFVRSIELSERTYHCHDVWRWLERAALLA